MKDKAFEILHELIKQRGYQIVEASLDNGIHCVKPDGNVFHATFVLGMKVNIKLINELINYATETSTSHLLIVYDESVTSMTQKAILNKLNIDIELFHVSSLQYNITKHIFQPDFKKLSNDEVRDLNLDLKNLPKMLKTDAIALFFNYKRTNVIEIKQKQSGIISHRVVI